MPARIPLAHDGQVPLHFTGDYTAITPRLSAGDTGLGDALAKVGQAAGNISDQLVKVNDERQMLEAEELMRGALKQQSQFQSDNEDESTWQANWEKVGGDLRKKIDGMKISPSTRTVIDRSLGQVIGGQDLQIMGQARSHGMMRLEKAYQKRLDAAAAEGNLAAVDQTERIMKGGQVPQEKAGAMIEKARGTATQTRNQTLWGQAESLVQLGKFDEARGLLQSMNMSDAERERLHAQLERGIQTTERKIGNEKRGQFYGDMLKEIAGGAVPQQEKMDAWFKEHPEAQAQAQELSAVLQTPKASMETVEHFINDKVLVYNPALDKEGADWAELQKQAVLLGLNPAQADRVGRVMAVARGANSSPEGRLENQLRKMGRERILEVYKKQLPVPQKVQTKTDSRGRRTETSGIDSYQKGTNEKIFSILEDRFNVWFNARIKDPKNAPNEGDVLNEVAKITQQFVTPASWRAIRGLD